MKTNLFFVLVTVTTVLSALGCAPDNLGTCQAYAAKLQQAHEDCGRDMNENDIVCSEELDSNGKDCEEYYTCLANGTSCIDGTLNTPTGCGTCVE